LNEINETNWVVNHCYLAGSIYLDVVMKCKCKKICRSISYRSVMKTLSPNVYFH